MGYATRFAIVCLAVLLAVTASTVTAQRAQYVPGPLRVSINPFGDGTDPFGGETLVLPPGVSIPAQLRQMMSNGEEGDEEEPQTEEGRKEAELLQKYQRVDELARPASRVLAAMVKARLAEAKAKREQEKTDKPERDEPPVEPTPPDGDPTTDPPLDDLPPPDSVDPDEKPKGPDPAKLFYQSVTMGDWDAVREHLAGLPEKVGPKVYDHLLGVLANSEQMELLPEEIIAAADASPKELTAEQLARLGQLLRQSFGRVEPRGALLEEITQGTRRLGGDDPSKRLAAARLLVAAGLVEEATPYIPPLDEASDEPAPDLWNLHALRLVAVASKEKDKAALSQSWELTCKVLAIESLEEKLRNEAFGRALALLARLPEEETDDWVKTTFAERPTMGMQLLASVVQQAEQGFQAKMPTMRLSAIKAQDRIVGGLLEAVGEESAEWQWPLKIATLGWIREARLSVQQAELEDGEEIEHEMGLNPFSDSMAMQRYMARHNSNDVAPLGLKAMAETCPNAAWREAVGPDMARQILQLSADLAARSADQDATFASIAAIGPDDPERAKRLAEQFLQIWLKTEIGRGDRSSRHDPYGGMYLGGPRFSPSPYGGYSPYGYSNNQSDGIPLTRAKQVRNLALLGEMLRKVDTLKLTEPVDPDVLAGLFEACHSPAEVFRGEDLQSVFGTLEDLPPELLQSVVSKMRINLAGQWRKPDVQQQQGTRRTDQQQVRQVVEGYGLAVKLVEPVVQATPDDEKLSILLATLWFDQSEFLYGQKADLETYTALRDRAFATYRKAAETYVASIDTREEKDYSVDVHAQWFKSALGASDLAYLTRQDRPDADQVDQIVASIASLGDERAEKHLALFGKAVSSGLGQLPPRLKPRLLREAARVLGDHPEGEKIRDLLQYYDDLLGEIELAVVVDGNTTVGRNTPFGVHLALRSTDAVARESGGFNRLLTMGYSRSTGQPMDHKKTIEEMLQEKLSEAFEIELIRFHELAVDPRSFGRPGWQETPLAYVVLRAKDPAVDRIPSVNIDLEFSDSEGAVLLPVASRVVPIDARPEDAPPTSLADVKLNQLLDDRAMPTEGHLLLEVTANAKGLLGRLEQLVDLEALSEQGLAVAQLEDHGLEIDSLDTEGAEVAPQCLRRWQLTLKPTGTQPPAEFAFLAPCETLTVIEAEETDEMTDDGEETEESEEPAYEVLAGVKMEYQRYDDVDIVDVASVVGLGHTLMAPKSWATMAGIAVIVVLLGSIFGWLLFSRPSQASHARDIFSRPEPLTPFNLVVLLRRIHAEKSLALADVEQESLQATIDQLQQQHFHPQGTPAERGDLIALVDRWLAVANDGNGR